MTQKTANIEVPSVLKECLLSLTEIRDKIRDYYPKSEATESVSEYANRVDDLIDDVVDKVGEMIRVEIVNTYFYNKR